MDRILVIGANGQIGSELVPALGTVYGTENVIAADLGTHNRLGFAHYMPLDVMDRESIAEIIESENITQVYQLAAMLSAMGEAAPLKAWNLNMQGLMNVLEIAREHASFGRSLRIFWPSSIAAFGPSTPADAPQTTVMDPTSIYGISKLAGERLCEYYFLKYGVDARSIRYPGIISHKSPPGGGTTDYAIAIFHTAVRNQPYRCFLKADTTLPMIYMSDAVRATIDLMRAPLEKLSVHSAYNVAGVSFDPQQLAEAIRRHRPDFKISYAPDARQTIAESWPDSMDDTTATQDWGWQAEIGLDEMVVDMLESIGLRQEKASESA